MRRWASPYRRTHLCAYRRLQRTDLFMSTDQTHQTRHRITRNDVVRALLYGRLGVIIAGAVMFAAFAFLAFSEPI